MCSSKSVNSLSFLGGQQVNYLSPKICLYLSFEEDPICELAELKVHWAQP